MNGARMRSYSLSGTRPEKTSRSVPRLSALATARTRTSPAAGGATGSARISAWPGADVPERLRCSELARRSRIGLPRTPPAISCAARKSTHDRTHLDYAVARRRPARRAAHLLHPDRARLDGRADLAPVLRAVRRRLRRRRLHPGGAVRRHAAVVGDRLLERHHRARSSCAFRRSGRGRDAGFGARDGRRADHREDRDPVVRAQRGHRARHPQHRADDGGDRGIGRGRAIPCLHPERHQLSGDRRRRGAALRRAEGEMAGPARPHLPAAHRQHRLQGRQHLRLLHALGRATTTSP